MLERLPDAVGRTLKNRRAGADKITIRKLGWNHKADLRVSSLAFGEGNPIPQIYTADGEGLSPPLAWSGVPSDTASLLLLVEDEDSPTPVPLVHAIVIGLGADRDSLPEGALESPGHAGGGLRLGRNSFLKQAWLPPDPPPGHGPHHYIFQIFALGREIGWGNAPGRDEVVKALQSDVIAAGCLTGTYERDAKVKADRTDGALAAD